MDFKGTHFQGLAEEIIFIAQSMMKWAAPWVKVQETCFACDQLADWQKIINIKLFVLIYLARIIQKPVKEIKNIRKQFSNWL